MYSTDGSLLYGYACVLHRDLSYYRTDLLFDAYLSRAGMAMVVPAVCL